MRYEFATARQIVVGPGTSSELAERAQALGRRALVAIGRGTVARQGPAAQIVAQLQTAGLIAVTHVVTGEPHVADVEAGASLAREAACDVVIGIGGGSVLDSAKAIAGLAANTGGALEYLEVVGAGKPLQRAALPIVAVPTTAGTGSEVTRNAVVAVPERSAKASMRHPSLLPHLALVDSTLTHDLPPDVTASSGLDALTQLLEAYVSRRAQPVTDGMCIEGLTRAAWALRRVYHNPDDAAAREAMSTASLLSGLALANAGLGAVHGIAAPLGGSYPIPHGIACAALLPHVTAANIRALHQRNPDGPSLARYARAAEILLGSHAISSASLLNDLVQWLHELVAELKVSKLANYGLTRDAVPVLVAQAQRANSMRANPIDLEEGELAAAIESAL